jgi:hypothetical protein
MINNKAKNADILIFIIKYNNKIVFIHLNQLILSLSLDVIILLYPDIYFYTNPMLLNPDNCF